ncbi:MAG: hypothetical protein K5945_11285 [Bacteroidaceae bacterium]|nr:hypothetical protein [Bacteroidaceae bacterium]
MKRFILFSVVVLSFSAGVQAQRIEVVDTDGKAVPYAKIYDGNAECIGMTGLNGVLADAKGVGEITVTHVAFKSKEVKLSGQDIRVTLEDADFELGEITVSPKPLVYVQTYYRMFMYDDEDGIIFYRAGLIDNYYDKDDKKLKSSEEHISKGLFGAVTKTLNIMFGPVLKAQSRIRMGRIEESLLKSGKDIQLKITPTAPDRKNVSDYKGLVGTITDDQNAGQRRFAIDAALMKLHHFEANGDTKAVEKREKRNSRKQDKEKTNFIIYNIDSDGNYAPEDFVMKENSHTYDTEEKGKKVHTIIGMQVFSTDRAYVTKDELKQRRKANKIKMTYQNIQQFERQHNIPLLAPVVQAKLDKLWAK